MLGTVNSPRVVCLRDFKKDTDLMYSVIDFCPHGELYALLNKVGFTEEHTKAISLQIAHGLRDIHNCRIANLDLNPSNILIDEYFGLKITNFSCAHLFDEKLEIGKWGSQQFMSPELIDRSLKAIDEDLRNADIWSLGILLFVL